MNDDQLSFVYGDWTNNWKFTADVSEFPENQWHAVYLDYNGGSTTYLDPVRFRIRKINTETGEVTTPSGTWESNGAGYSGNISGTQKIGANADGQSPWSGMIASVVITTLKTNSELPWDDEISKMALDPATWLSDYKEGQNFRQPEDTTNNGAGVPFEQGTCCNAPYHSSMATKVYMFGDPGNVGVGAGDVFPNIKNRVYPGNPDSKMFMKNMVEEDIVEISIPGF